MLAVGLQQVLQIKSKMSSDFGDNVELLHGSTLLTLAISSTNTAPLKYMKQAKGVLKTIKMARNDGYLFPTQFIFWLDSNNKLLLN